MKPRKPTKYDDIMTELMYLQPRKELHIHRSTPQEAKRLGQNLRYALIRESEKRNSVFQDLRNCIKVTYSKRNPCLITCKLRSVPLNHPTARHIALYTLGGSRDELREN